MNNILKEAIKMKKVVAEFVYSLNDGGAENLIKNYCKLINRSIFDVIVVVMYDIGESAVKSTLMDIGIPIIYIYPKRNLVYRGINYIFGKEYVMYKMGQIINDYKITSIHAHTAVLRYLYYSKSHLNKIKLLYTCHSTPNRYFSGRMKQEDAAARYLLRHNELQMVALHDEMAEEINCWFNINNTIVIRNGLILSEYNRADFKKEQIRKKLGINKNAFVIGHVGRFIEEKNHELILKIFGELKKKKSSSFLLLVGDGELENEIKKYLYNIGGQNDFLILSHRNDVPQLLSAMDVFLFPSKVEGLGIALVEAQVSALPCIISENIPREAIISNNVYVMKNSEPVNRWIRAIDVSLQRKSECDKNKLLMYNLEHQVRILEKYY